MTRWCEECGSPYQCPCFEGNPRTPSGHNLTTFRGVQDCLGVPTGIGDYHSGGMVNPRELAKGVLEILGTVDHMSRDQKRLLCESLERLKL
jgi:hypothetical protein